MIPKNWLLTGLATIAFLLLHLANGTAQSAETGLANFYADYLHGRTTAYGEIYDRAQFTCAHRTYRAGTLLRITRLDNGRSVVARVNDKGPFTEGYVVSLSLAAAMSIGLEQVGRARVQVEVVGHSDSPAGAYASIPGPAEYNTTTARSPLSTPATPPPTQRVAPPNPAMPTSSQLLPKSGDYTSSTRSVTPAPAEYSAIPPAPRAYNTMPESYSYTQPRSYSTIPPASTMPATANTPPQEYGSPGVPSTMTARGLPTAAPAAANAPMPQSFNYDATAPSSAGTRRGTVVRVRPGIGGYGIQVASFSNFDNASRQAQALADQGVAAVFVQESTGANNAPLFRVFAGNFRERIEAETYMAQLRSQYMVSGFVARM